ncbi:molybdate ABC transporter substrate-binding protein [Corynebacterium breve]|uniref:Molybdate ABC transporter substrate-binding protein n=1 Tax=Corynebacterium breve TaxID=3049799 RepID=A0ABY8VM32_9CORY|nr:molybdate ABC transporter substrate-binding protein [Corynebacterium breve]WIM68615.1 molybdate ABC transporter substrate-binding protein [Corynebacterium breve]
MRLPRLLTLALITSAALTLASCSSSAGDGTSVTVLGAASTRVLNDELVELFGSGIDFVNAGSSTLVQQLADGSPGDVLITADSKSMDQAVANGSVSDPRPVATNSMVMVVPIGNPAGISSVNDLEADINLVLCDPQVPCGGVSEELIEANDLDIAPVSLEHSVSDTLGKVTSGEADAGWVYRTDAASVADEVEVISIPHAEEHPNTLLAAVTTGSTQPEKAAELMDVLTGAEMAQVWTKYGFTPSN